MLKARFILDDDSIKVVWESTDRVLTSEGKYQAVFSEKVVYEISIAGPALPLKNFEQGTVSSKPWSVAAQVLGTPAVSGRSEKNSVHSQNISGIGQTVK